MSMHTTMSSAEAADRLAIRELVEAYARCADRLSAYEQARTQPFSTDLRPSRASYASLIS